ncbi:FCD domain-containing protein [Dactylosporangium sp. NPDC000521]|uniref:FCD domain-containing protein n=1 Tax=Dactylosporangium sp. NPDC000521 TaxID=3363975 RepID=UPI00369ABBD4
MQFALLSRLAEVTYPYGARLLHKHLEAAGFAVSEASVSRVLLDLDDAGLTSRAGSKGRLITDAGRQLVRAMRESRDRDAELARALDISTIEQVFDLLHARRGVESEAARAAAEHITDAELDELKALLGQHRDHLMRGTDGRQCALVFHRRVTQISGNPLLVTLGSTILSDQLDYLEGVLDVVAAFRGSADESPNDHSLILEALAARDPDAAERAMRNHLSRLLQDLKDFAASDNTPALSRVLRVMQG